MHLLNRLVAALIRAPRCTHPDGKSFARINDHWLPI